MLCASLLFFAFVIPTTGQAVCPPAWIKYNKQCFYYDGTLKTWVEAQARCQVFGGNLASVHNEEEYAFIQTLTETPTWLGGTDCQRTGAWFWIDGTPLMFRFWCILKPDNDLTQCCLQMNTGVNKCWDDMTCSTMLPFVCARPL